MSSFYVKRNRVSWTLMEEIWVDGIKSQKTVPRQAFPALALNPAATLEEARKRVKQLNKEKKFERQKAVEAARRVQKTGEYDDLFFPQELVDAYIERIRINTAGSDDYLIRLFGSFKFAQKMILALKILPHQYYDNAAYFYDFFATQKISVDYAREILALLNGWGKFVSRKHASFFEDIPPIPKKFRTKIARAQRTKTGVRTEPEQLTVSILAQLRHKLPEEQYGWLFVSLWLGLRPVEVDQEQTKELEILKKKTPILVVNQTKTEEEDEDESLKYIPILYPEQELSLKLLRSRKLARPKPKVLKALSGLNIDTYSGRKGFMDLMQSLGQRIEDVSLWLGHKDIKTSLAHYKDPSNVPFTPVDKKGA